MPFCEKRTTVVTQFVRRLRGGAQSILAQAGDGLFYVVKFAGNPQGENLLFNESAGAELYRACGLNTPSWKPLLLTDAFLDRNPQCWFQTETGLVKPTAGLCFGSSFLGDESTRLFEILPEGSFNRIRNQVSFWLAWLVDICAEHADNRQALFLEDARRRLDAYFVAQGHLFGGPKGNRRVHFVASRYLDFRVYPNISSTHLLDFSRNLGALNLDALGARIRNLPDEWMFGSALDSFQRCLNRLSDSVLLQNLLETIVPSVARRTDFEQSAPHHCRAPEPGVLRSGVQPRIQTLNSIGHRVCHPVCD